MRCVRDGLSTTGGDVIFGSVFSFRPPVLALFADMHVHGASKKGCHVYVHDNFGKYDDLYTPISTILSLMDSEMTSVGSKQGLN